jgi:hypothetical protein
MCVPDSGQLKGNNAIEIVEWPACESSRKTTTHLIKHSAEALGVWMALFRESHSFRIAGNPEIKGPRILD